jgi:Ribbon-helix-helix protein, copG family
MIAIKIADLIIQLCTHICTDVMCQYLPTSYVKMSCYYEDMEIRIPPKKEKKNLTIRVADNILESLEKIASKEGMSRNELIEAILEKVIRDGNLKIIQKD